jgi:ABC-type transporter Mla subunit MlaD
MNVFRREIRTGLLVVVTVAVLVAALVYLGAPGAFVPQNTYFIYVENAAGLKPGNEVLLAGRRVGQVVRLYSPVAEAERPKPALETLIEIIVSRKAPIYKDVKVTLTQNGLLGEMMLDFTSSREVEGLAPSGHTFIAERPATIDQAVPLVIDRIDPALKKVTETLDSLQEASNKLAVLMSEEGEVNKTIAEFRKFGINLNELSGPDSSLRRSMANLETMTGEDGKLGQALDNIEDLTGPGSSLAKTLKNAEEFTNDLANNKDIELTLRNFREASNRLNSTVGGLGGQFSSIANNLEQASDTVKRQPWRLIWPSTKKYPEERERAAAAKREKAAAPQRTSRSRSTSAKERR